MQRGRRPLTGRAPDQGLRLVCSRAGGASHNATGGFAGWSGGQTGDFQLSLQSSKSSTVGQCLRQGCQNHLGLVADPSDELYREVAISVYLEMTKYDSRFCREC
jgi:hypothetical protein